jgi:hypothetical protein
MATGALTGRVGDRSLYVESEKTEIRYEQHNTGRLKVHSSSDDPEEPDE